MITSLVSFRRGTGKTNIIANVAYQIALRGYRIGIADIDLHTPSTHVLFGLDESNFSYYLNNYLCGECEIEQAVLDLKSFFVPRSNGNTPHVEMGDVFLLSGEPSREAIHRVMKECFTVEGLVDSLLAFNETFNLDFLLVDTHAGINEYVLAANSVSDLTMVVMHMDSQEYQGTAILIDLMSRLSSANAAIVVSNPPKAFAPDSITESIEKTFRHPVVAVLPHSEDMLGLGSRNIFSMVYPEHAYTNAIKHLVDFIVGELSTDEL